MMGIGTWLDSPFSMSGSSSTGTGQGASVDYSSVNPTTLLPMTGNVDIMGNPWGTDLHSSHHWDHNHHSAFSHDIGGIADHTSSFSSYDPYRGW